MKCQPKNRHGSLGFATVDKLWLLIPGAAWLWALATLVTGLATAGAWRLSGTIALAVAGFVIAAYAAARARARVRYEAYARRVQLECNELIEKRDLMGENYRLLADDFARQGRHLAGARENVTRLTSGLDRAVRDLVAFKASAPAHYLNPNRPEELPLREALEMLDLIDTHHYRGDDGAEWQVTAFREKATDAFVHKAPLRASFARPETTPVDPILLLGSHKLPHPIPLAEVESVSITLGVDETPDPTGLVDAAEDRERASTATQRMTAKFPTLGFAKSKAPAAQFFERSQHQQAVDDDRRENRRRYHAERLDTLDPDSPLAAEVGRDKLIEILQSGQRGGVQVAEVRALAQRLGDVSKTLQLHNPDASLPALPVVAEATANVIGVAQTLATTLESAIDERDELLGRVVGGASNAAMAAKVLAEREEIRELVRQLAGEVAALRALPAFGNQTEPLARMQELVDQLRRQLHMSGADAEEDATGN